MAGPVVITIDVPGIDRLFASFDPSPFHEFSLNRTAGQYIASQAYYAPAEQKLVIHLAVSGKPASRPDVAKVQSVLQEHFARMANAEDLNLMRLLRIGWLSLGIGLCVLAFCTMASRAIDNTSLPDGWREGLRDGISMFGWVANWRPAQILFYDWWPLKRNRDVYRRLSNASVAPATFALGESNVEAPPIDTMPIEARA